MLMATTLPTFDLLHITDNPLSILITTVVFVECLFGSFSHDVNVFPAPIKLNSKRPIKIANKLQQLASQTSDRCNGSSLPKGHLISCLPSSTIRGIFDPSFWLELVRIRTITDLITIYRSDRYEKKRVAQQILVDGGRALFGHDLPEMYDHNNGDSLATSTGHSVPAAEYNMNFWFSAQKAEIISKP